MSINLRVKCVCDRCGKSDDFAIESLVKRINNNLQIDPDNLQIDRDNLKSYLKWHDVELVDSIMTVCPECSKKYDVLMELQERGVTQFFNSVKLQ